MYFLNNMARHSFSTTGKSRSRSVALAAALICFGCASRPPAPDLSNEAKFDADTAVITPPPKKETANVLASKFALMALFAKTTYRKDLNDEERARRGCEYIDQPTHDHVSLHMPNDSGWKRRTAKGSCHSDRGLFFETYIHTTSDGKVDEAVIGIRGTENTTFDEIWEDWRANLSGLLHLKRSEYTDAEKFILPLIKKLSDEHPGVRIYLTGHSLGGGIAQQIAYLSEQVLETFTFDTSPVTNWTKLKADGKIKKDDPVIHRVYLNHELLAYVRELTTRFNTRRFNRSDYGFYFKDTKALDAHEMSHLACGFAARIPAEGADHYYTKRDADAILQTPVLCPDGSESATIKTASRGL